MEREIRLKEIKNTRVAKKKNKQVTAEMLLKAFDRYKLHLLDDPKVSATKFDHFQTAIYGCKLLVKDAFDIPRSPEMGLSK